MADGRIGGMGYLGIPKAVRPEAHGDQAKFCATTLAAAGGEQRFAAVGAIVHFNDVLSSPKLEKKAMLPIRALR